MILVDTSVWVSHLRRGDARLAQLLREERVVVHPFVLGEIALGRFRRRERLIELLSLMPADTVVPDVEVRELIEKRQLSGSGIGYVDAHLVAAAITHRRGLLTDDKPLATAARSLGVLVTF